MVGGLHGVGDVGEGRQRHDGRLRRVPRVHEDLRHGALLLLLLLPEHVLGGVPAVARTAARGGEFRIMNSTFRMIRSI